MKYRVSDHYLRRFPSPAKPVEIYDTVEPGVVVRIRPTGHTSFWLYLNRGAKKIKLSNWPQVHTKQARLLARGARSIAEEEEGAGDEVPSLEAFLVNTYIPNYSLDHRSLKSLDNLKPFRRLWGDVPLDELSDDAIDDWRIEKRKAGLKPASINRYLTTLNAALAFAVRKRVITTHPLSHLKKLKEEEDHRVRWLSEKEENALRQTLLERDCGIRKERLSANQWRLERGYRLYSDLREHAFADHLRPMVLLTINTGLRRGELFSLKWNNVGPDFVKVTAAHSKSLRSRNVPLNNEAKSVLTLWKEQAPQGEYVFSSKGGQKFDNVYEAWNRLCKKAELTDFRWHDLRHHFASTLVMRGIDLNTVRELLGHGDLKMTLRYAHLAPSHLRAAVEVLSNAR